MKIKYDIYSESCHACLKLFQYIRSNKLYYYNIQT